MSETTQPESWPSPRGPWPEVTDSSRLFDHGRWWCATAAGHPDPEDGYPDPDLHVPWHECRTVATSFDDVRLDLSGPARDLDLYAAAAFQYGALRSAATPNIPTRIVLEWYSDQPDAKPGDTVRFSLPVGEALRVARRIERIVDLVTCPPSTA